MPRLLLLFCLAALAGCAGSPRQASWQGPAPPPNHALRSECAPYARQLSGILLYGEAADWWEQAARQGYARSHRPAPGSVLVLRRSARLPQGHVSVVTRILSSRSILVSHANWVAGEVGSDNPVVDVSAANDWSEVRIWWPPSNQMGAATYAAAGFVLAAAGGG